MIAEIKIFCKLKYCFTLNQKIFSILKHQGKYFMVNSIYYKSKLFIKLGRVSKNTLGRHLWPASEGQRPLYP